MLGFRVSTELVPIIRSCDLVPTLSLSLRTRMLGPCSHDVEARNKSSLRQPYWVCSFYQMVSEETFEQPAFMDLPFDVFPGKTIGIVSLEILD